ncbi:HIT family protein [Dethiosulfatarculus sandiegensis]|uniref:HIT family hydrolase n=1 Tax=Dethiosulfatarculus sandiegensis TaxID=1429043 RepID=A0A0D2GAA0_9BACT|nr:HIT domain-containing protein [Dethiosulfatarculus sandiegensis]KIX11812.1 HIT family hydrolase [Dethiosulfatarculus sandiegensis]
MKNLWAPWRMTYILDEEKPPGCIFCLAKDGRGADDLVLGVGEHTLVMMNKFPYNNGHLLVAPRRHKAALEDLTPQEKTDLMQKVELAVKALKEVMNPQGFNVGLNLGETAGAGIAEHLHFHVVPRWGGDVNFMTVMGEVRVIPEHIRATYEKLKPHFAVMEKEKRAS